MVCILLWTIGGIEVYSFPLCVERELSSFARLELELGDEICAAAVPTASEQV
jgi:hypothetical protein